MIVTKKSQMSRQCGILFLLCITAVYSAGNAQAQGMDHNKVSTATKRLLPGEMPDGGQAQAVASTPPPQPGGLLHDTVSAPPLTVGGKFSNRMHNVFGVRGLVGVALAAGVAQLSNTPSEWGQGAAGYGQRYASSLGINLTRQTVAFGLDSALHEDPRYFASTEDGLWPRTENAVKQILFCKKDDGSATFAYSKVVSAFASGYVANAWQPNSTNGVDDGFYRGLIILAGDGGVNLIKEIFPLVRSHTFGRHHRP